MQVPSPSPVPPNKPPAPWVQPSLGPLCLAGAEPGRLTLPAHVCAVGGSLPLNTFLNSSGNSIIFVSPFLLFAKTTFKSQPVLQPACISPSLVASADVPSSPCPITQTANGNTGQARTPD